MPTIKEQIATELTLRTSLLPNEITEWNRQSKNNDFGMGIHQSQVQAVTRLFDGMLTKQNALKEALSPEKTAAMAQEEFTKQRQMLEQSLTGTHSIMATFRYIFSQRDDTQPYKKILDAADLVAAYCYLPCMKQANRWRDKPADNYREPPLIHLNAKLSPAAITRRHYFGFIGLELHGEEGLQLPISIISLPFHDTTAFWTLSSIYHEVGHVLDQDLKLRDEFQIKLLAKLDGSPNKNLWGKTWRGEIIADAFGVLLGGAGFARALMNMLFKTKQEVLEATPGEHPNSYVRMFLVSELLRKTRIDELRTVADSIVADWKAFYGEPPEWQSYVRECATVAEVLLEEPLTALNQKCLMDFARDNAEFQHAPDLQVDFQRTKALAKFLLTGQEEDAFTTADPESLIRLVPGAAQWALQGIDEANQQTFEKLHTAALDFILKIEHPQFLAGGSAEHNAYLDSIIDQLDFSSLNIEHKSPAS
jgi:hypothetical protein